uniref:Uncharacterized protein n=1 Tax=Entomoneis paludosa TaxID=265537 RepID=A0A7S3DTJ2_9STRA|mmetsp:Transcript_36286/g.75487  ORF Transcript_36286/g.75487 Transcript_36286/m.75487 type:complete len:285 (+) Transcript_36286:99-953(+)
MSAPNRLMQTNVQAPLPPIAELEEHIPGIHQVSAPVHSSAMECSNTVDTRVDNVTNTGVGLSSTRVNAAGPSAGDGEMWDSYVSSLRSSPTQPDDERKPSSTQVELARSRKAAALARVQYTLWVTKSKHASREQSRNVSGFSLFRGENPRDPAESNPHSLDDTSPAMSLSTDCRKTHNDASAKLDVGATRLTSPSPPRRSANAGENRLHHGDDPQTGSLSDLDKVTMARNVSVSPAPRANQTTNNRPTNERRPSESSSHASGLKQRETKAAQEVQTRLQALRFL